VYCRQCRFQYVNVPRAPGDERINVLRLCCQVDEPGEFSNISQLKNRPAHIAVVLHFLLSNSDPCPLVSLSYQLFEYFTNAIGYRWVALNQHNEIYGKVAELFLFPFVCNIDIFVRVSSLCVWLAAWIVLSPIAVIGTEISCIYYELHLSHWII